MTQTSNDPTLKLDASDIEADGVSLKALVRRAAWPLAIKALPALYGAGLILFVIRVLPPVEFGRYGVAFAYINLLAVLTRGLWAIPLITWAARGQERNILGPVFWLSTSTAALAALGALLILPALDIKGWLPLLSAAILLALIPRELGYALAQAHGRYRISFGLEATYFIGSLLSFGVLHAFDSLRNAEIALGVNLAWAAISSIIAVVAFPILLEPRTSGDWKGVIRYGRWIGVLGLTEVYLQQGDALLIGAFVSPGQIASYLAARTVLRLYALFSQAINFVVLPVASRLAVAGRLDRLHKRLVATFRSLFLVLLPANAILWLWSSTLFPLLLGNYYTSAVPYFRILVFATFLEPIYSILGNAVAGIGRPDLVAKTVPAAIIFNVAANLILLPWIGLQAAPFVLVISYAILSIQMVRISGKILRATPSV